MISALDHAALAPNGTDRAAVPFRGGPGLLPDSPALTGEILRAQLLLGPALVEAVQALVRAELQTREAPQNARPLSGWVTPPAASRAVGIPVKAIYGGIREKQITPRLKNTHPNPRQRKYVVHLDEVIAYAARTHPGCTSQGGPRDVSERAREILAHRNTRKPR
jgi:hypothetical protein